MLFDEVISGHLRALTAFFADRTRSAMILRVDPDIELLAARFLALLGTRPDDDREPPGEDDDDEPADENGDDVISFGASLDFLEPRAFYSEAAAQIAETASKLRDAYAAEGEDVLLPDALVLERPWAPLPCIEAAFAEYLERVARGLAGYHPTVAFALRIDAMPDPRAVALSLARLGGYLVYPGVKLVVFDHRNAPRLPALRSVRTRYTADAYQPAASDPEGRLSRFLASDDKRVLGLWVQERNLDHLAQVLGSLKKRGLPLTTAFVEAEFDDRTHFADSVYRRLATGKAPPPAWAPRELAASGLLGDTWPEPADLPPDIYDLRALDRPESTLVESIERAMPVAGLRCIVVRARPLSRPEAWPTFVRELAAASVGLDTRFIVLDVDGTSPLPDAPPEEYAWAVHDFVLDASQMHVALEASVQRPDLPIPVRVQHLTLLAGLRTSQGRHPEAAELSAQSIELAEQHGLRAETVSAWWALGRALQRAGNYEYSRNAYAESTSAAIDAGSTLDAANSLMGLGHTWYLEQNWSEAIQTYAVALEHWKNGGQVFGECQALIWTGEAYRKARVFDQSEAAFMAAIDRYQTMQAPFDDIARAGLADAYERLAAMHRDAGKRALADECSKRAREHGSRGPVPDRPS